MSRLSGLDALRGVAAIAVAFVHLLPFGGQNTGWVATLLAVDVFFILSGFVMARTYERRMADGLTAGQIRELGIAPTMSTVDDQPALRRLARFGGLRPI